MPHFISSVTSLVVLPLAPDRKDLRLAHSLLRSSWCSQALTTRRSTGTAGVVMAMALLACAGCFVDPINHAPYIASIDKIGTVQKNRDAELKITAYDPDSDRLTVTWAVETGRCADDKMNPANWPVAKTVGAQVEVGKAMTTGRFCVWAFATDPYGAMSVDNLIVDPANQPPQAIIDVIAPSMAEPYQLYSQVVMTSDNSSDPDDPVLTFNWALMSKPVGSSASLDSVGCVLPKSSTARDISCFSADQPGQYVVALTATEGASDGNTPTQSTTVTRIFNVNPDRLPCITMTKPMYGDGEIPVLGDPGDATFEVVMVDDDGDPFPTMTPNDLSFSWFLTGPDGHLQTIENNFPSYSVGLSSYHIGDLVKVRLEVHDRNRETNDRALLDYGDADVCGDRSGCFQRVTWKLLWSAG